MINCCCNVLSFIVTLLLFAALLGTPSFFYDSSKKLDIPIVRESTFHIKHEANVMMGLAWLTIAIIIIVHVFSICWEVDFLYGVALFFIWFTMTIQCAYVDKSSSLKTYLRKNIVQYDLTPKYYGEYNFKRCYKEKLTNETILSCIHSQIEEDYRAFKGSADILMYLMIGCSIASLFFLANECPALCIGIFALLSFIFLAFALPVYTAGMSNRSYYRIALEYSLKNEVNLVPVIATGFVTWIIIITTVILLEIEWFVLGFLGIIAGCILEIVLVVFAINANNALREFKDPNIIEAKKIFYGLTVPHIIICVLLGILLLLAFCVGGSGGGGSTSDGAVASYAERITVIIETPTHYIVKRTTRVYG